jgi:putative sensory transduction regulator
MPPNGSDIDARPDTRPIEAQPPLKPAEVEAWLAELELTPSKPVVRDGVAAWDVELDGRRRFDIRVTIILDPALGLISWVHFAPPIGDGLRKAYRTLLRWNDEFPFVKFSIAEDGRPTLSTEIPLRFLGRDELGLALARSLAICDALLPESAGWLWIGGRMPDQSGRRRRNEALLARYAGRLPELLGS